MEKTRKKGAEVYLIYVLFDSYLLFGWAWGLDQLICLNSLRQPQKLGWALVLAQNRSKAAGGKWKSGKSSNQPTCGLFTSDPV